MYTYLLKNSPGGGVYDNNYTINLHFDSNSLEAINTSGDNNTQEGDREKAPSKSGEKKVEQQTSADKLDGAATKNTGTENGKVSNPPTADKSMLIPMGIVMVLSLVSIIALRMKKVNS
ncbi:hypothetical protein RWE15_01885 [Virgibacillus halophilus]|uniref:Uncharacterized protein n=1 Tax=Tigheibacillus halophilus TaxID=361280 RepID=A0ABU5C2L5_9BACI|nr:hypothetical protein [Virgibacillus halophilus]